MSASEQVTSTQQETLDQYRQLFEQAPVAYHEIDTEGIIRRVNEAECRLLGYSPDEMIGRMICDFVAPQNRERCRRAIALKMLGAPVGKPFRRAYRTKTNREIIVEIYEQVMRDSSGEIIGVRSALVDVTEQVEAQEALERNQQWIPRILHALPKPLVIVDPLGTLTFMNQAAEELFE
jgi:PAS domain S-box-containing protein